ncbi:outer membrane protein assembly factor, partial [Pseudoalteromonas piscicida]
ERLKWNAIDIEVLMRSEPDPFIDELVLNVPIKLDEPVRHDLYQKTKAQLESALLARGYFDFRWIDSQLRVNKKRQQTSVVLRIEAGVRYRFGGIVMNTDVKAKTYIRQLAPFQHN